MKSTLIKFSPLAMLLLVALLFGSCEDPNETFNPVNPNLSGENVQGTIESAARTLNGAERQMSLLMNEVVVPTEIASDNYENTQTFYNQFLDALNIVKTDPDLQALAFDIARLRELTSTGLNDIGPGDAGYTDEQRAGFHFLRGAAYMLAGELYNTLPAEVGGIPVSSETNLGSALAEFTSAIEASAGSDYGKAARITRARTYYRLGDRENAVSDAQAAIDADGSFVHFVRFDADNEGAADNNTMQDAIYDRGTLDDLQPLPTLDFLDPKYNGSNPSVDISIPFAKIEEAHLILAEAQLSQGNLDDAKSIMKDIVALVATRPTATFSDRAEGRDQTMAGRRPDSTNVLVSAGPDRPLMDGLVIYRQGDQITVPTVSGTHYTDDEIDEIDDIDFAYESLYRMRQEIFIAEGRRMTDLGIKFVISEVEELSNPNVTPDDVTASLSSYIEAARGTIDGFSYDAAAGTATVTTNLNKVIAENRGSSEVAPFE